MLFLFEQEEAVRRYGNRMWQEGFAIGYAEGFVIGFAEGFAIGYAEGIAEVNRNTARRIVRYGGDVRMILKLTDLTEAEARRIYDEETGASIPKR